MTCVTGRPPAGQPLDRSRQLRSAATSSSIHRPRCIQSTPPSQTYYSISVGIPHSCVGRGRKNNVVLIVGIIGWKPSRTNNSFVPLIERHHALPKYCQTIYQNTAKLSTGSVLD